MKPRTFSRSSTNGWFLVALIVSTVVSILVSALPAHALAPAASSAREIFMTPPRLTGDPTVGGVLTANMRYSHPRVQPEGGTPAFTYSWTRDGQTLSGESQPSYRVLPTDVGHVISAYVSVTYDADTTATYRAEEPLRIAAKPRARGFDGDNTLDIFARDRAGQLWLYPTDGHGNWRTPQVIGTGWNTFNHIFSPGDFDGDGTVDVMARDGQGRLFLYQGNGSGGWKKAIQVGQGWQDFTAIVGVGDFNGDGTNDVLVKDTSLNVRLYPGDGYGGWRQPYTAGWAWWLYDVIVGVGHFSGTSRLQLAARNGYSGLQIFETRRDGWFINFANTVGWGWSALTTIGSAGDFNGDGNTDVFGIDRLGTLTMYYGRGLDYDVGAPAWNGQSTVGWGWGGFTAVF